MQIWNEVLKNEIFKKFKNEIFKKFKEEMKYCNKNLKIQNVFKIQQKRKIQKFEYFKHYLFYTYLTFVNCDGKRQS